MTAKRSNLAGDAIRVPAPPSALVEQPGEDLRRLGDELKARTEDVLELTVERTKGPDHDVDTVAADFHAGGFDDGKTMRLTAALERSSDDA